MLFSLLFYIADLLSDLLKVIFVGCVLKLKLCIVLNFITLQVIARDRDLAAFLLKPVAATWLRVAIKREADLERSPNSSIQCLLSAVCT